MREKPTWKEETWLCPSRKKRFTVILHAPQIVEHKRERKRESEGRERERERKESLREGKVQEEKVEKENGECTCNLTVMKGTPRKECNKTKVKWVRFGVRWRMVGGAEKKKKKEKKDLEFPARCLRTLRLPPGQSDPMKWESQADLLSQTLFS